MRLFLPYTFDEDGFTWVLLGIENSFTKANTEDCFISAQYENQYGHTRQLDRKKIIKIIKDPDNKIKELTK